jgi:tRNA threonylcarbamoyladenosine biosynthesis protein TsaE
MTSVETDNDMRELGKKLGTLLKGGEVIELIGDVGAGKTTLVKGIAEGLGIDEDVQSPSFTISRVYPARDDLWLHHYDFYRLNDPGVMQYEFAESIADTRSVTIIEWADTVHDILPASSAKIVIKYNPEVSGRQLELDTGGYRYLREAIA